MAKRRYSKKGNKIEPAVMTLSFQLPASPFEQNTTSFIDLSQVASLVNRRFYRQGINWAVAGFKFLTTPEYKGNVTITKLPNTWVMSNAWEKGFRAWQKMNRNAMEETESVRPKFLDFKIYADAAHHNAGYAANLLPYNIDPFFTTVNTVTPGEWESSKLVIPNIPPTGTAGTVDGFEIIAVGANDPGPGASGLNAKSLIEGYAASRALPNILDPNTPADAASEDENWLMSLFNEGTRQDEEVVADMIDENNIAPYPFENDGVHVDTMYPNGANQLSGLQIHSTEFISGTTVGGTTRVKGGNFPCGLIGITQFQNNEGGPFAMTLEIDLIPGPHRGYLCEKMTEM